MSNYHNGKPYSNGKAGGGGKPLLGGLQPHYDEAIRDARIIERAVRERWPIKQEYREAAVKRLALILADKDSKRREQTAAVRALGMLDALNMEQERRDLKIPDYHEHSGSVEVKQMSDEELERIASAESSAS